MQTAANPSWSQLLKNPILLMAFGFGSGMAPRAAGTAGSLLALILSVLLLQLPAWAYCLLTAIVCVVGVYICGRGAQIMQVHDHSGIVWDEFAGMWLTLLPIGVMADMPAVLSWRFGVFLLLGFILFRFFDVLKPPPINYIDKHVGGGLGIMLDDIVAGLASLLLLQIIMQQIYGGSFW